MTESLIRSHAVIFPTPKEESGVGKFSAFSPETGHRSASSANENLISFVGNVYVNIILDELLEKFVVWPFDEQIKFFLMIAMLNSHGVMATMVDSHNSRVWFVDVEGEEVDELWCLMKATGCVRDDEYINRKLAEVLPNTTNDIRSILESLNNAKVSVPIV